MKTNQAGINLIKKYEGCQLVPYICSAGHLTVGYGHRIKPDEQITLENLQGRATKVLLKDVSKITLQQADSLLKCDLAIWESYLNNIIEEYRLNLTTNQFGALVSFCYNTGVLQPEMKTRLCNRNLSEIAEAMLLYTKVRGKELAGLVARRREEVELFNTPV